MPVFLCSSISLIPYYVRNSELFLGKRCLEIYESEYVTDQEKKEMFKDFYSVALYPHHFRFSFVTIHEISVILGFVLHHSSLYCGIPLESDRRCGS